MTDAERQQRIVRLIECTGDGNNYRSIVGIYDVDSMRPDDLAEQRGRHNREFVYARDYDDLLADVARLQAERDDFKVRWGAAQMQIGRLQAEQEATQRAMDVHINAQHEIGQKLNVAMSEKYQADIRARASEASLAALRGQVAKVAKCVGCPHENRAGGNDYILCHDCGVMWDYLKETPMDAIARQLSTLASAATPEE